MELKDMKRGTVARAGDSLIRKSNRNSWYEINSSGHRLGTHNSVRSHLVETLFGRWTQDAETELVQEIGLMN